MKEWRGVCNKRKQSVKICQIAEMKTAMCLRGVLLLPFHAHLKREEKTA
jgi:hypothetical protein